VFNLDVYVHFTGAALVLNSVYTVLREEESVVNQFWLELLYYMVVNLSLSEDTDSILGSQEQVATAVNHIERVLKEKAFIFNKVNIKTTYFLKTDCLENIVQ
jgi:DNA-dependent protein kinase catalytic subunit